MFKFNRSLPCLVVAVTLFLASPTFAQFEIVSYSIDGGGGLSEGGGFTVAGTSGQPDAGAEASGGTFTVSGGVQQPEPFILGDVNGDGTVNLLDVSPFVNAIANNLFIPEADINEDGVVNLLDVDPFVNLLAGG